jgi:hypothetical protein
MTQNVFTFIKLAILNGMPSGLLVTKNEINLDIGYWQHKSYENDSYIIQSLSQKWCSKTINIFEFSESTSKENIIQFLNKNKFIDIGRLFIHIYCLVFPKRVVDEPLRKMLKSNVLSMDNFSIEISVDEYSIFVNDFIKNILFL